MKNQIITICLSAMMLFGCNQKNPATPEVESSGGSSSFTADNETYNGKVETQYFGSDEVTSGFSIVCQQDEPLALLQMTFANEKSATESGTFAPNDAFMRMESGEINVALSGTAIGDLEYVSKDESTGSFTVKDRVLTLKDVQLTNREGAVKTVNAQIAF